MWLRLPRQRLFILQYMLKRRIIDFTPDGVPIWGYEKTEFPRVFDFIAYFYPKDPINARKYFKGIIKI